MLAERIIDFHRNPVVPENLPPGVSVLNPFSDPATLELASRFYHKYYGDNQPRTIILGINPGRLGGGTTGIPFTDPVKLETICGIQNSLPKKAELSADFIYQVIAAMGGPHSFYSTFYINSYFPLALVKEGKNLNYYDQPALKKIIEPVAADSIRRQLDFGINRERAFCLGGGENFKAVSRLNQQHAFFREVIPLPHPRFIMQYRRKYVKDYIQLYKKQLTGEKRTG